ncbi:molecular chaperone GrpE [Isoptericola sp. CG 20/1183]|uniref:Protein GrpE n=1 Tax=Isoptericola halotolerans TaxID=300560 RepID=A0ABX5ECD5_9MICO|nr:MULTISPECIES: nucleotide exchange factor GrpE [Isoptericola]PRZ03055.1 molecular chaperone GrpE [Isoptericola sp. CG 20/1183]PRZ03309.1 molecular chaperone GrpE [Isoptericola halotolerans]
MTSDDTQGTPERPEDGRSGDTPFHFRDKRKVDPTSGEKRPEATPSDASDAAGGAADAGDPLEALDFEPSGEAVEDSELLRAKAQAAENLDALQRERASFTNYRNRALRDQEAARTQGTQDVLAALLPVLDDIERAKQHAELSGPMAAIAEKLDASLVKFGIERFGRVGEEFDPTLHEALMHNTDAEAEATTINLVVEPGYRIGDKVVRAARVGVVGPE